MTTIPTNREALAREVLAKTLHDAECPQNPDSWSYRNRRGDICPCVCDRQIRAMLTFAALSTPAAAEGEEMQADRNAAEPFRRGIGGSYDQKHQVLVQAFAHHSRRQSVAEAVERCARIAEEKAATWTSAAHSCVGDGARISYAGAKWAAMEIAAAIRGSLNEQGGADA